MCNVKNSSDDSGCKVPKEDAGCASRKLIPQEETPGAARCRVSLGALCWYRRCKLHVGGEGDGAESDPQRVERSHAQMARTAVKVTHRRTRDIDTLTGPTLVRLSST